MSEDFTNFAATLLGGPLLPWQEKVAPRVISEGAALREHPRPPGKSIAMSGRCVPEAEFAETFAKALKAGVGILRAEFVTGPGRSGAVAAVYASHILRIPFLPFGSFPPAGRRVLIVDTATYTGATLRKAARRYEAHKPIVVCAYQEPPRVSFWYEACNEQAQRGRAIVMEGIDAES